MSRSDSAHISPSAHYTGYVWYRNQLSDAAFVTGFGRFAHAVLSPLTWAARQFDIDLERLLLQRHLLIDELLREAIEQRGITQVVEIACGLSPRGRRFRQRYPHLHYLEADLPPMAARKRRLLSEQGWLGEQHQVQAVDILAEEGEHSLQALFARLDPQRPVLVITEGLVNYFELALLENFWTRLAQQLARFPQAGYLTDLYPDLQEHPSYRQLRWGVDLVGRLTRGRYYLHYRDHAAVERGFQGCGFAQVRVLDPHVESQRRQLPRGRLPGLVRVVEAWC